jgi:Flp pilus assembly protein protease CpaA
MTPLPAHFIAFFFLFISSIKDLRHRKGLQDKTYIAAILIIAASFLVTSGPGAAGASIVQAGIGIIFGIGLRLLMQLGGADVWTIGLIAATFPNTIIFKVIGLTFIPLLIWMKLYQLLGRKTAPAIPGLTAGLLLTLSTLPL